MTIYIDSDYICHTSNADGRRAFTVGFFDGKCKYFIEHYRYIPAGETWTRADGEIFTGELLTPAVNYSIIEAAQSAYEEAQEQIDMLTECVLEMSEILYE